MALRSAMVLVAGLAVISTAFSATQSTEPSSAATQDGTDAAKGDRHHPARSEEARGTPGTAQIAQAEPSKSAGEDEAFRSMTSDAVEAVRNFGKTKAPEEILSARVVDAIRDLDRATDPNAPKSSLDVDDAAENLRAAIREIVKHADEKGKPEDYVLKLIEEAVATSGSKVPVALLGADGTLDTVMLVQSVVGRSLEPAEADADAGYLAALRGEAATTATRTRPATPAKIDGGSQTAAKAVPVKFDSNSDSRPTSIVVVPGDTLGAIAWRYYGDALAYLKIYEANKDRLKSPNLIYVGAELRLP